MRERWRKVRRADGYKVSSEGRVRSVDRVLGDGRAAGGVPLTPALDKDGYAYVTICGEKARVHELVLETFVGPRPFGMQACHDPYVSRGRDDCRLVALRWDTRRENGKDKRRARRKETAAGETFPRNARTSRTSDVLEASALVTLVEAVEQGVLTCSIVAARKAAQRPGFPRKAGLRGLSYVWVASDLAEWDGA